MLEAEHDGSKAELRLGELNRPSKIIITQQLLVILARRNTTLDLRLLQPPDLHHFLGNCPGRSQKFVAPHSEHAYFGTSYHQEVVKALIILVAVLLQSGVWARRMPLRVCRTGVG